MKDMKIETQDEAIDVSLRIGGLAKAVSLLMNPVAGNPNDVETQNAARMASEAIEEYALALTVALETKGLFSEAQPKTTGEAA